MRRRAVIWALTGGLTLLSALAALPAQAGGCHPESPEPSSAKGGDEVTVPVKGCEFGPTVIHVPEGANVTWVNHDPVPHTVTGANLTWGGLEELSQGDETQFRFDESGTFPYYCYLHPGMAGAVVVGDGESDDIVAAPAALPPTSSNPPSGGSGLGEEQNDGMSTASTIALAGLALGAGIGAGIAINHRSLRRSRPLRSQST
jgi:plastocyanin